MSRPTEEWRNRRPSRSKKTKLPRIEDLPALPERYSPLEDLAEAIWPELEAGPDLITQRERAEFAALLQEKLNRQKETLRLYEPFPEQDEFHRSKAVYRLARGGNRGGKTLVTAVELARAITRQDPYGKWPMRGRFIVAGRDLLHLSKVVYRKIFKPGAIQMIWDEGLQRWRAFHPDQGEGGDDESLAVDAPPLVPRRFYDFKRISWEDKREEIPRTIRMKTDWELTFFSGKGEPPQGWDVDGVLFDEEIEHQSWFREMIPRLVDRRGKLMWSATPQVGTIQLYELSEKAAEQIAHVKPRVTEHFFTIRKNPFIAEEDRANFIKDLEDDEDEYQVRVEGNFALRQQRVYPEFSPRGAHRVEAFPIPDSWCRYVAIDPGRQTAAALFLAVPPPKNEHTHPIVYDELYIKRCNAQMFAEIMTAKLGNIWIQGWLIDHHEGQKHDTGSGKTVETQYSEALRKYKAHERNGFKGFIWASDDVEAGTLAAKTRLHLQDGATEWGFMVSNLKFFCWEIERYVDRRISTTGQLIEQPVKRNDHLMDCFRYLALHRIRYVSPKRTKEKPGWTNRILAARRKRRATEDGWGGAVRLG